VKSGYRSFREPVEDLRRLDGRLGRDARFAHVAVALEKASAMVPFPEASEALDRLRSGGLELAVLTNRAPRPRFMLVWPPNGAAGVGYGADTIAASRDRRLAIMIAAAPAPATPAAPTSTLRRGRRRRRGVAAIVDAARVSAGQSTARAARVAASGSRAARVPARVAARPRRCIRAVGPTPGTTVPACHRRRRRPLTTGTTAISLRRIRGAGPTPGAAYQTRRAGAAGDRTSPTGVLRTIVAPSLDYDPAFPAAFLGNPGRLR
jgi:hypothetical protein